jgi:IclR family transcriptional regulator, KDG regulon repressor
VRNTAKNENNTMAKGKPAEKETSFSKSILKTLSILEQYSKADELGIKELSESTGIPASTVQRIVNTLVMKQYLVQNPHTLKYQLGIAFFNISSRYSNSRDWVEVAKAHMEEQVEKTQETVNLAILQGKSVIYLTKVDSPHILRPNFTVGTAYPALNTALGRCLLAYQPWDKVERMIRLQPNFNKDINEFHEMLEEVERNGYATEDEEFQPGLFCIAAPVWDANDRVVAAISTSIPKIRLDESNKENIIGMMQSTASQISLDLKKRFTYIDVDKLSSTIR